MTERTTADRFLPIDHADALLVGRAWLPGPVAGPAPVLVRGGEVLDVSGLAPTMSHLLELEDLPARLRAAGPLPRVGTLDALLAASLPETRGPDVAHLLAPCDLQTIKACGVTFAASLLERVIEEQARGDASRADAIRAQITDLLGTDLSGIRPGSAEAMRLKALLVERGAWSQYLEVGIGPDAEVFTKSAPMSSVGVLAEIGIHPASTWNNPEPEVVLAVNSRGETVGATLGNDVNLRDVEGRSALLLGRAKDNNASCAIGPFIRLFDGGFGIDDVRAAEVGLTVEGPDGFVLKGASSMARISRDPLDLVAQVIGQHHQYPDGFMLFLGTMFAPVEDRDQPGGGFTHKLGDVVTIASPRLGALVNRVTTSDRAAPWAFGTRALFDILARRAALAVA